MRTDRDPPVEEHHAGRAQAPSFRVAGSWCISTAQLPTLVVAAVPDRDAEIDGRGAEAW
jgi:hypothetical protein